MKTDQVSLKHKYNDKELADLSHQIVTAVNTVANLKSELDAVRKDFNAQIASNESLVSSLCTRISSGFEMVTVKCLLIDERLEGYRLVIRTDNGHVYKRRKLTQDERQLTITEVDPVPYHCAVLLKVDDDTWPVDIALVPLYEDEWDALRELPDVVLQQMNGPATLAIEALAEPE